jgi:hypothetical protein
VQHAVELLGLAVLAMIAAAIALVHANVFFGVFFGVATGAAWTHLTALCGAIQTQLVAPSSEA